jgi:hypothetical protein
MAEQRYRISNLGLILLYKIYSFHIDGDEDKPLSLRQIGDLFPQPLPLNLVQASIDWMRLKVGRDYLRRLGNKENYRYSIAPEGIKFVEMELLRKSSPIAHFREYGDESLTFVAGLESPFMTEEERRSIEDWRPIDFEKEDPQYKEAEQALDEAITAIEQDNELAAKLPEEREGLLQTLRDGVEWLKEKRPTKRQLQSLLVSPLNWIISNFARTVMAEAAKKAAEKLLALLTSITW